MEIASSFFRPRQGKVRLIVFTDPHSLDIRRSPRRRGLRGLRGLFSGPVRKQLQAQNIYNAKTAITQCNQWVWLDGCAQMLVIVAHVFILRLVMSALRSPRIGLGGCNWFGFFSNSGLGDGISLLYQTAPDCAKPIAGRTNLRVPCGYSDDSVLW